MPDQPADALLTTARRFYVRRADADALVVLSQAIQEAPALAQDPEVRQMAADLTGQPADAALALLASPERVRGLTSARAPRGRPAWLTLRRALLVIAALFVAGGLFGQSIAGLLADRAIPEATTIEADGVRFDLLVPDTVVPEDAPFVVLIPEDPAGLEELVALYGPRASATGVVLVMARPAVPAEGALAERVDEMKRLLDALAPYPMAGGVPVLAGHGAAAELVSALASRYPDQVRGVVLTSPTFIHPIAAPTPYLAVFGELDPMLDDLAPENVAFADMAAWPQALDYVVIAGADRDLNPRHPALLFDFVAGLS
jgi:hypothetical protein